MVYLSVLLMFMNITLTICGCAYKIFGTDHTMCIYKENACQPNRRGFTPQEAELAVKAHNDLRQKVASGKENGQPKAANMKEIVWDEELAKVAQRYADQCTFGHDTNRRTKKFSRVGQNVYTTFSTSENVKLNPANSVNAWYNEVINPGFNSKSIKPFKFDSGIGHFSQVVWASTEAIGCGLSIYKMNKLWQKLIVCNYGPSGNWASGEMYKAGKPCSECKNKCSKKYNALCN